MGDNDTFVWTHKWTPSIQVTLEFSHWKDGRSYSQYTLLDEGKVIFEGKDFSPPPSLCWNTEESVIALLGFLTLQEGDTDQEYFDSYTQDQLDWAAHSFHAESLRIIVHDYEERENG